MLVLLLIVFAAPATAAAEVPPGPRLATVELIETEASERDEDAGSPLVSLATIDPSTGKQRRFLRSKLSETKRVVPSPFYSPAWSGDGSLIAFSGYPGGEGAKPRIFVANGDGSGVRPLSGTARGTNPVFSPDGHTLAFARSRSRFGQSTYFSTTTWIVDLQTGESRRLTRWRSGLENVPGSFSPDGSSLLLTKRDSNLEGPRVVLLNLGSGESREVLSYATEPALSPDGSRIAFTGYLHPDLVEAEEDQDYLATELYVARADGSQVRRLSRSDDVIESSPSWDPSGQRIAYVQVRADTSFVPELGLLFPTGNALMQVNADGSCRKKILSQPRVAFYGAAWQPGPGREAGPIAC
jgi:Tol biopolymer transport system component